MNQATHAESETGINVPHKPILPRWVMDRSATESRGSNDPENAGFAAGSALTLLHVALHDPGINVPTELLKNRLALRAAVNCNRIEGRVVTEGEVRDVCLLTTPGNAMGPSGDMLAFWRAGVALSFRHAGWQNRLIDNLSDPMREKTSALLDSALLEKGPSPITAAATVLGNLISAFPHEEAAVLLITDIVLARMLGWGRPIPLSALHMRRNTLRQFSEDGDLIAFKIGYFNELTKGAQDAIRLCHDLARRAARLRAVEPKLRTKGASDAVQLFLSEDAVLISPMLTPTIRGSSSPMTPRSARRFCDRLVELGVARELTDRATFRLYGVA